MCKILDVGFRDAVNQKLSHSPGGWPLVATDHVGAGAGDPLLGDLYEPGQLRGQDTLPQLWRGQKSVDHSPGDTWLRRQQDTCEATCPASGSSWHVSRSAGP